MIKSHGNSETNVAVGGGSGCAGGDDGNGEETERNGADCEYDDSHLDVSGTGDIIIQRKATAQARNSYKNVTLKDVGTCFKRYHTLKKFKNLECMSKTLDIIHVHIFNLNSKVSL